MSTLRHQMHSSRILFENRSVRRKNTETLLSGNSAFPLKAAVEKCSVTKSQIYRTSSEITETLRTLGFSNFPRFSVFCSFFFENRDSLANLRNQIVEIPSISAGDLRDSRKFRDCGGRTGKKGVKISVISNAQTLYYVGCRIGCRM